ncbi:MAG: hypothetical protein COA38_02860 [Fluviicola sp.]|nr:MAG: hypothetical protein COA38_02860 [Fluviicola sp.]
MKKSLAIALMFTAFGASAQQKLIGTNTAVYDETGALQYIDSSEYLYNSWDGSLFSNEPQFTFEGSVVDWTYELPAIKWDTENKFFGFSLPLTLDNTWQNTLVGGNATVSETPTEKTEFAYDGSGNLINLKSFYFSGSVFLINDERTYEFDANNNLIVETFIVHWTPTPEVQSIDSLFYDGSNNLTRYIAYEWDGTSAFETSSESLMTYSGSEVSNVALYVGSPLTWIYDIDYTHAGGLPTALEGYPVTGGVPDATVEIEIDFTYGANNKLSTYEGYLGGDLFTQQDFSYDAQDFISEITNYDMDMSTSMLYVSGVSNYYYQSTLGVNDMEIAEARIFPNPSSDFVTISTDSEIEKVSVYGLNGLIMITQNNGDLDISNLPAGVYIVKVKTSTGVAQARFVKQ